MSGSFPTHEFFRHSSHCPSVCVSVFVSVSLSLSLPPSLSPLSPSLPPSLPPFLPPSLFKALSALKLEFLRIVCDHEHFIPLNLPFPVPREDHFLFSSFVCAIDCCSHFVLVSFIGSVNIFVFFFLFVYLSPSLPLSPSISSSLSSISLSPPSLLQPPPLSSLIFSLPQLLKWSSRCPTSFADDIFWWVSCSERWRMHCSMRWAQFGGELFTF